MVRDGQWNFTHFLRAEQCSDICVYSGVVPSGAFATRKRSVQDTD